MSVMVIHHLDDSDRSHLLPVEASVRLGWRRFVGRLDDEAVAALQIQRELTGSVSLELMETPGKATENFQGRRRAQVIQPPPQYSRLGLPPLLPSEAVVVAELSELLGFEDDIHRAPPCQERLTPRVHRLRMLADAAAAHQPASSSAERAATWASQAPTAASAYVTFRQRRTHSGRSGATATTTGRAPRSSESR